MLNQVSSGSGVALRNAVTKPSSFTARRASRTASETSWGGSMAAPLSRFGSSSQKSYSQLL